MLIIHRLETDPFFNIAAEEYLLKNFKEDIFTFWVNEPCIVVGKHQNALAEINYQYVKENSIPVIRRITGGGTVYQDAGNLNYSFILSGEKDKLVDYKKHTRPVIDFLGTLGIHAKFEAKSNLMIDGKKISGNSAHVHRTRVIHHGTLLYASDLAQLRLALSPGKAVFYDKSVKSNRAPVTNISDHLADKIPIGEFSALFSSYIMNDNPGSCIYQLTEQQKRGIHQLADEKYRIYEWNFGYSPDYQLENEFKDGSDIYKIMIRVNHGKITDAKIKRISDDNKLKLGELMTGLPHREDIICEELDNIKFAGHFTYLTLEEFINHIF
jgi:lipoate---protein ligase